MNIGIIGLGLIGGSLAKSIKARTSHTVFGVDIDKETLMFARICGAMDNTLTEENLPSCDMILLALTPQAAIQWTTEHASQIPKEAILIDMCGVKRAVCKEIGALADKFGFTYIGGHPMAGKERGGFVNATPDLFEGSSMILIPPKNTAIDLLERSKNLFTDIGFASITFTTPEEHDRIIAYTSQLAHITSGAYIKSPTAQKHRGFSAGSFKDMTRVALLDEKMWTELFFANCDHLTDELELLIENLNDYLNALKSNDKEALCKLLKDGKEKKALAGGN